MKITSRQRRRIDRGEYTLGVLWPRHRRVPPRMWYMGEYYTRQNRTVETWPWPGDPTRYRPPKLCRPIPCPPFQDATLTVTATSELHQHFIRHSTINT